MQRVKNVILNFLFQDAIELALKKINIDTENKEYTINFSIDCIETPEDLPFDKIYKGILSVSDEKTFYRFFDFTLNARENIPSQTTCELVETNFWKGNVKEEYS